MYNSVSTFISSAAYQCSCQCLWLCVWVPAVALNVFLPRHEPISISSALRAETLFVWWCLPASPPLWHTVVLSLRRIRLRSRDVGLPGTFVPSVYPRICCSLYKALYVWADCFQRTFIFSPLDFIQMKQTERPLWSFCLSSGNVAFSSGLRGPGSVWPFRKLLFKSFKRNPSCFFGVCRQHVIN